MKKNILVGQSGGQFPAGAGGSEQQIRQRLSGAFTCIAHLQDGFHASGPWHCHCIAGPSLAASSRFTTPHRPNTGHPWKGSAIPGTGQRTERRSFLRTGQAACGKKTEKERAEP